MPSPFPPISPRAQDDRNPAIRLFGRRFFADQTVPEYLVEFLLVAASEKRIAGETKITSVFPEPELLCSWPANAPLEYAPKAHLNLKLFAFLGASRLDSRHSTHRQHYRELVTKYTGQGRLSVSGDVHGPEVLRTLENLFLGFQGIGAQRTWCAASFLPVTRGLLACESIWQETKATANGVTDWFRALQFFSHTQQVFLARGGELLYLQLCNLLRKDEPTVRRWASDARIPLAQREADPRKLRDALQTAISAALDACPPTVGKLAEFLDADVDPETSQETDYTNGSQPRWATCGWCPEESWPESLLFALEVLRVCEAVIDPIERIELLEFACAMQVLRALCAQSSRQAGSDSKRRDGAGPMGFVWVLSDPRGDELVVKQISRRNINTVQRLVHDAIRRPEFATELHGLTDEQIAKVYKDADQGYGHKLFMALGKRIGLIVPRRGSGARFVLSEKLLRYLVLALIRPGERVTYDTFKDLLFAHYGIAVDDRRISSACEWTGTVKLTSLGRKADGWLLDMLNASGVLINLSDSCSLVANSFGQTEATV